MTKISYSQLSMFSECPHRWKLNYVDKLRVSESNIFLIFGTAMHEVLQKYLEVMYHDTAKRADMIGYDRVLREKMVEGFKQAKESEGKAPCTKEELQEFYEQGVEIIDFFIKKRGDYFSKRNYELIGCEVPIEVDLQKNIKMIGYLDVVIRHIPTNTITIMDIKTSTMGWNKWQKKDENKTQQLLLYKQFYSKQYDVPIENIEVEYFIVKRKLYENCDWPQKRIQQWAPASGKISMNRVGKRLGNFIDVAFNDDGSYNTKKIFPEPSKKACRFCEFNQTEYCSVGVK
tara:strand:+ start:1155 stop:2015 length:861 start_codon:yes stop_codon:yes gene_type:complete